MKTRKKQSKQKGGSAMLVSAGKGVKFASKCAGKTLSKSINNKECNMDVESTKCDEFMRGSFYYTKEKT